MDALRSESDLITLEQYESIPEDTRVEVFDGVPYNMSSPSAEHQIISMELLTLLNNYIKKNAGSCRVFHAPFDVMLGADPLTIVQPDILVICDRDKLDKNRCNGAPDFIIEIVSPSNPSDDYIRKLSCYKASGVREYWIVDPLRRIVTVYYFEENIFCIQYTFDEKIKVNIYPDLYIDFSEISALL